MTESKYHISSLELPRRGYIDAYAFPRVPSTALSFIVSFPCPDKMPTLTQFRLPDPLARWPWPRTLNPHYADAKLESDAWLRSFEALDAKSQRSFDRCNFGKYTYCFISVSTINNIGYTQPFSEASRIHLSTKVSPLEAG
jgi:hypothetical protein